MPTDEHEHFMRRCVALGRIALQRNNPPVGSLLVSGGRILAEASEEASSSKDVTDHAELILLKRAWPTLNAEQKRSAILYSTHEPCVMCSYAIRHYGVPTIVYGCRTPFAGGYSSKYSILRETEHASWTTVPRVIEGILETECLALSAEYETRK